MMLKWFILFWAITLFFPLQTFAHGGFEKVAGNILYEINQDPISPLVGEKVNFYFNIKDTSVKSKNISEQNLTNQKVKLTISDTVSGVEGKDKVIFKKDFKTDENGNLTFSYTFNKENYFDIDLETSDKNGKVESSGFLVRPRSALPLNFVLITVVISFLAGLFFYRIKNQKIWI